MTKICSKHFTKRKWKTRNTANTKYMCCSSSNLSMGNKYYNDNIQTFYLRLLRLNIVYAAYWYLRNSARVRNPVRDDVTRVIVWGGVT